MFIVCEILISHIQIASARNITTDTISKIQYIIQKLDLFEKVDTLPDGFYYGNFLHNGHPLTIFKNNGSIDHIGYSIFSEEQRICYPSPIYNFLERYSLEVELPHRNPFSVDEKLKFDNIHFEAGSFNCLKDIINDSALVITINKIDNREYNVNWKKDSLLICDIFFPASYELIIGKNRVEYERDLPESILRTVCESPQKNDVHTAELIQYGDSIDGIFVLKNSYNEYSGMSNEEYYHMNYDSISMCDTLSILYSLDYPIESFYNLFTTNQIETDFVVNVNIYNSNFHKDNLLIPLQKLLCFFMSEQCEAYLGVLSFDKSSKEIEAVLEMRNNDLAYEHMMKIEMNLNLLYDKSGIIDITMWPYIPTHYLKFN